MPPVLVTRRHDDRTHKTASGTTAVAAWDVVATSTFDALSVLNTATSVGLGSVFTTTDGATPDAALLLRDFDPEMIAPAPTGGTGLCRIVANYSTEDVASAKYPTIGGPAKWDWSVTTEFVEADRDKDGNPIVNSRNMRFANAATFPVAKVQAIWRKYVTSFSVPTLIDRSSSVNDASWNPGGYGSVGARVALCTTALPQPVQAGWYLQEYRFDFKEETWDVFRRDEDEEGNLLDGAGNLITSSTTASGGGSGPNGSTLYPINSSGKLIAMFLRWRKAKERDFSTWGL